MELMAAAGFETLDFEVKEFAPIADLCGTKSLF